MVKCRLCNEEFYAVTPGHLQSVHGITLNEYLKRFPGAETGLSEEEGKRQSEVVRKIMIEVEKKKDDPVFRRALKEPAKWEMMCPECGERISVQKLMEANKNDFDATDLRYLFCPYHPFSQAVLKPIRTNLKGLFFLTWRVICDYMPWRH